MNSFFIFIKLFTESTLINSTSDSFSQPFLTNHNYMVLNGKTQRVTSETLNTNVMFVASRVW